MFLKKLKIDNYSDGSIRIYKKDLIRFEKYLKKALEIRNEKDIQKKHITSFIIHIRNLKRKKDLKPCKDSTKMRVLWTVKKYLEYLCREDHIKKDFTYLFKDIKYKKSLPDKILTEKELEKVVSVIDEQTHLGFRDRTIIELMYCTGMRKSEVINLELYDIDFDEKKIFIRQGKGRKDRIIPMSKNAGLYLREYIEKVRPVLLEDNVNEVNIFISSQGKAFGMAGLEAMLYKYSGLSGVGFSAHHLRHTFASHMLKNGASIIYIQEILGHEELSTTEVYTRLYPEDLKEALKKYHPRYNK